MNEQAVHDTHKRVFQLILRHGSPDERDTARAALGEMREWRLGFPGSWWEPIEQIDLPGFLQAKARRVAKERVARAERWGLDNQHGTDRDLEEEERTVCAQYSGCLILGIEFDEIRTHRSAKAHGNIGHNTSVLCPRPGNFGLLIAEDEKPSRRVFLIYQDTPARYSCQGWVRAGEAMQPQWLKPMTRTDKRGRTVHSKPYLAPNDLLRPTRDWER